MDVIETSDKFFEKLPYSKDLRKITDFMQSQLDDKSHAHENFESSKSAALVLSNNSSIQSLVKNAFDKDKD